MIVAIPTAGKDLDAQVDSRFGRSIGFILYDTKTGNYRHSVNNLDELALEGAGVQAGTNLIKDKIEAIITGHCGPKAFRILSGEGIQVYLGCEGTIRECLAKLQEGELQPAEGPDVEDHWS